MKPHSDPLASTSFLDLLSCGLAAVVIVSIAAGGDAEPTATESVIARVGQARSDNTSHLVAIRVGNFLWYSGKGRVEVDFRAPNPVVRTVHREIVPTAHSLACGGAATERAETFPQVDDSTVFSPDRSPGFTAAVRDKYGVDVVVADAKYGIPASALFVARTTTVKRIPAIFVYYDVCMFDQPHEIVTSTRWSRDQDAGRAESLAFSRYPPTRADITHLTGSQGTVLCASNGGAWLRLRLQLNPSSGARFAAN